MGYDVKQSSTAYPLVFLMIDSSDHIAGKTGLSPTVTLRKPGGSFASPSGSVTEIANGWYQVAGNATDSNTLGPLLLHATATGADPVDEVYNVVAYDPQDAVRLGLTALPNATAGANGGLPLQGAAIPNANANANGGLPVLSSSGTTLGYTVTTVTNLTNAATSGDLTATMKASVNTEADTALSDYGALKPTTAGRTLDVTATGEAGIDWANVGSPTTTLNLSGTTVKTATDVEADTQDLQGRLPAALVSGRIDASVGAYQTGLAPLQPTVAGRTLDVSAGGEAGLDWSNIGANTTTVNLSGTTVKAVTDAVTVGTINADVVNASALAADAVTEIQNGLATAAALSSVAGNVTTLLARITSTLFSGITSLASWLGALMGKTADGTTQTEIRATTAGAGYTITTDSLEALRDRGDAAWVTATGFSTHTAADVWAVATRVLTAGTNIALAKGTGVTGFNDIAAADVWAAGTRTITGGTIGTYTGNTPQTGDAYAALTASALVDGKTVPQALQICAAVLGGIVTGAGTTQEVFKGLDGSTTRVTVTVDASGNRSAVVYG